MLFEFEGYWQQALIFHYNFEMAAELETKNYFENSFDFEFVAVDMTYSFVEIDFEREIDFN